MVNPGICEKCGGKFGKPVYVEWYTGFFFSKKHECLRFICENCGYTYHAECENNL